MKVSICVDCRVSKVGSRKLPGAVSAMEARDDEYLAWTVVEVMKAVTRTWILHTHTHTSPRLTRCRNGLLMSGREMK